MNQSALFVAARRFSRLLLALLGVNAIFAGHRYTATDLKPLGFSAVTAINNKGQIVGTSTDGRILFWDGTRMVNLGTGGGVVGFPTALNNSGQIVGYTSSRTDYPESFARAFLYSDGLFVDLSALLPEGIAIARAINDAGVVVGDIGADKLFRYANLQMTVSDPSDWSARVNAVNSSADFVGTLTVVYGGESVVSDGFYHTQGLPVTLGNLVTGPYEREISGGPSSDAMDINDAGTIAGTAHTTAGGRLQPTIFIESQGRMLDLGPGLTPVGWAPKLRINNRGVLVGTALVDPNSTPGQAIMASAGTILKLNELFDSPSIWYGYPVDINDRGEILTNGLWLFTPTAARSRLVNISSRSVAGAGDRTNIAGFVVAGGNEAAVLVRTIGPALSRFGVINAALDPALKIVGHSGQVIAENDDWTGTSVAAAATRLGAFALPESNTKDAALLARLPANLYSVHAHAEDLERIVLTEIYDAGAEDDAHLVNASIRTYVGTGESIGIMGFVVAGDGPCSLLIRAVGPSLASHGVSEVLQNPKLWLYRGDRLVLGNDDWGAAATQPLLADTMKLAGAFSIQDGSKDAAILVQVEPGAYSVHVAGVGDTTGVALIELYVLP